MSPSEESSPYAARSIERGSFDPSPMRGPAGIVSALLTLAALALPQQALFGEAFVAGLDSAPLAIVWHRVGGLVGDLFSVSGERVRYACAAIFFGASYFLATGLAIQLGCTRATALAVSALILTSPTAWLAATTPGLGSLRLLLLLALMRALLRPTPARRWTTLSTWGLAAGTGTQCLLLWPALAGSMTRDSDPARSGRAAILAGLTVLWIVAGTNLADWDPLPLRANFTFERASGFELQPAAGLRLLWVVPGLGIAALGIAHVVRTKPVRGIHSIPHGPLTLWCALPALHLLRPNGLTWDTPSLWLLPAALVGTSLLATRLARLAPLALTLGLALQLALTFWQEKRARRLDPDTAWREATIELMDPSDTIITGHVSHAYLATHRFGLRSVILCASDPEAPSSDFVDGVYVSPRGASNLLTKTQNVELWAQEGVEARGYGFRPVLDRPFPGSSNSISATLERELRKRVDFFPLDSKGTPEDHENSHNR